MTSGASLLGEAELHGLIDGHLAVERRADVLRKLAASPADRALVEAWQEQNDLIRAAFHDVEHESLPVALDLAPPRLRCIEGGVDGGLSRALPPLSAIDGPGGAAARRTSGLATFFAVLIVGAGLAGVWLAINPARQDPARQEDAPVAAATPPATEATLAERTAAALADAPATAAGSSLPLLRIPDLAAAGLRLTGASMQGGEPTSLVLHYRDARDGRVVLGVAGASDAAATPPEKVGGTLVWRRGGASYALAGTLSAERLRTLARSMQDGPGKD